ncbi:mitochondrial carrier domain-containing protein [Phaeosphaeriaceae sp. PMI808]|nr:mitochondrial carrier domain-containing protein [Phaeosphaeriaceae sp. PMI808]
MATSRDGPNPLRPYYIPPSIGPPTESAQNQGNQTYQTYQSHQTTKATSLGSQARDILGDLDYDSYFPDTSPTVAGHAKRLVDQALWNYTSILLAQPFEVAKTILQIHEATGGLPKLEAITEGKEWGRGGGRSSGSNSGGGSRKGRSRPDSFHSGKYEDYPLEDESDEDSPGYFTSTSVSVSIPSKPSPSHSPSHSPPPSPSRSQTPTTRAPPPPPQPQPQPHRTLDLKRADSLLQVIAQLWQKESAWGVWKGTNVSFIYNFLLKTTESWFRSAISALLNVPDPGLVGSAHGRMAGLDIIDSPSPLMSLTVAVAATAIAATILAPLDLVRTRLIVTPISSSPRSIYPCLALLPSLSIHPRLLSPTLLHACLPTLISSATPLVLRSSLSIDHVLTPTTYSLGTFLSSIAELFIRLPLETVLRRGQVAVLQDYASSASSFSSSSHRHHHHQSHPLPTIVHPGPYRGLVGSMWYVASEEGISLVEPHPAKAASAKAMGFERPSRMRKGQGVHGLWRGWRVGVWGLVGIWGAAALGGSGGGEF